MKKPRLFIGSSSEEVGTAKIVQRLLESEFDVTIWNDNLWEKSVFKLNSNFLHDLLKAPLKFDFGILIGSPDDKVEVRGKEYLQARDNILFELGLFIGRLGIKRSFFLVHENVKNLSDLSGIFVSKFNEKNLVDKVDEIKRAFLSVELDTFNFFPSNTLAYGYFENFVKSICAKIVQDGKLKIKGVEYDKCKFQIIIPKKIDEDINLQFERIKRETGVEQVQIECLGRTRPFQVNSKLLKTGELLIIDFPSTLTGINYAIRELLPEEYKEFGEEYENILNRELEKFVFTLNTLIKKNSFNEYIEIVRK